MGNNWSEIIDKVKCTGKWSETIMKVFATKVSKRKWRVISFRGPDGGESTGVVDLIAIRKDHSIPSRKSLKRGDLFEIILIQLKGGSASKPSMEDIARLRKVSQYYHAKHTVLFEWKKNIKATFYILKGSNWVESSPAEIFK
jgi:hypothetical protein